MPGDHHGLDGWHCCTLASLRCPIAAASMSFSSVMAHCKILWYFSALAAGRLLFIESWCGSRCRLMQGHAEDRASSQGLKNRASKT